MTNLLIKLNLFLILIGLVFSGCGRNSPPKNTRFKQVGSHYEFLLSRITADARFRYPFSTKWLNADVNTVFPEGSLFQITSPGSLALRYKSRGTSKWAGNIVDLKFNRPVSFIAERDMLRKMQVDTIFLDKIPIPAKKDEEAQKAGEFVFWSFRQAMEKIVLFVRKSEPVKKAIQDLQNENEEDVKISGSTQKLFVYQPSNNSLYYSDVLPISIEVAWLPIPKSKRRVSYFVYFWPMKTVRPGPVGETKGSSYRLIASKPGSYSIQVTTDDFKYQSKVFNVHIQNQSLKDFEGELVKAPDFFTPRENAIVYTTKQKAKVDFSWKASLYQPELHLVLNKEGEIFTIFPKNKKQQISVSLPPGKYTYWLQFDIKDKGTLAAMSRSAEEVRLLDVVRMQPKDIYADHLKRVLSSGHDRYLSFDEIIQNEKPLKDSPAPK